MEKDPAIQYLFSADRAKKYPDHILQHIKEAGPALGSEIYSKWDTLRAIDAKFGHLLPSHWKNKLRKDRQALLRKAWEGIPEVHRPEADDAKSGAIPHPVPPREHVWPFVNLEDLRNKTSLMLYLHARVRQAPSAFAMTEHIFMPAVEREPNNVQLNRMRLHDRHKFGHVEDFENLSSALTFQLHAQGLSPAEGMLVLYVQRAILDFLISCCKQMLPVGSVESLSVAELDEEDDIPSQLSTEQDMMCNHVDVVATAPFRPRQGLDMNRICHLLSTQLTTAELEVWQLREDPAHFSSACLSYTGLESHHSLVNAHGSKGAMDRYTDVLSTSLGILIGIPHMMLIALDQLRSQSTMIQELINEGLQTNEGQIMSNDLRKAIQKFLVLLESVRQSVMVTIEQFELFPEFRACFVMSASTRGKLEPTSMLRKDPKRNQVWKMLKALVEGQDRNKSAPFADSRFRLDQLDTWLRNKNNTNGWTWINPNVQKALSCLSVLAECSLEFELQPWYAKLAWDLKKELDQDSYYLRSVRSPFAAWYHIIKGYMGGQLTPSVKLGDPSDGNFDYPVRKGKNKKKVIEQMCLAELNLDAFWAMVDADFEERSDGHAQEALQRLLDQGGEMKRTKPWSDRHERWVTDSTAKSAPSDLLFESQPLSQIFHDSTQEITGHFDKSSILVRTKEKTRGKATNEEAPAEHAREVSPEPRPKIKVKKKTHQTFAQLFHNPDTNEQEGADVKWVDFVAAMTNVGFTAERMHGSQCQFNPTDELGLARGIAFHEPHPGSTLTHDQARNCGARLNRAYGWDYSTFVRQ